MNSMHDHRIVVDDQLPLIADVLPGDAIIRVDASNITNDVLRACNATALLIRSTTRVTYDLLIGTRISFVGSATAGLDHIEQDLLQDSNIRVVGAPGCNANAVAEYVVIWLSELNIPAASAVGIIGFGNVGQHLARYAVARGHDVLVSDPPLADLRYQFPSLVRHVSLDELLRRSDVISVHTPYTTSGSHATHNLINAERMQLIRSGALVINTARGSVIDEPSLCSRVHNGDLTSVLDVFANEPTPNLETVTTVHHCTPHIAGYSESAKYQGARMVLKALRAHIGADFAIPELSELLRRRSTQREDQLLVLNHPFRDAYITTPTSQTFEMCRRLTPLRTEHTQPPTWEKLHGHRA